MDRSRDRSAMGSSKIGRRPQTRHRLPGDPPPERVLHEMIRVDHAGEVGATRIYEGQLAVLGNRPIGGVIRAMAEQEQRHRKAFDALMVKRHVRPTLLSPMWHVAGFALGAASALLGERAAMACTVAVEEVIGEHYAAQLTALGDEDLAKREPELAETIRDFRDDELEHRTIGLDHDAEKAPASLLLTGLIKAGTRLAIALSKRL